MSNDYFYKDDPRLTKVGDFTIPNGWWSRPYEYEWIQEQNITISYVANMGCGFTYRPLTDLLTFQFNWVWDVDVNPKMTDELNYRNPEMVTQVIGDFTGKIEELEDEKFDFVVCVSVLEDVGDKIPTSLEEFSRVLKPDGKIFLTFDVPIREETMYPGVDLVNFINIVKDSNLTGDDVWQIDPDLERELVVNERFGLTCYHCILKKQ